MKDSVNKRNKIKLWIMKTYSRVRNKSVLFKLNESNCYVMPNGSMLIGVNGRDTVRGNRAKYIDYISDNLPNDEELDEVLRKFIVNK